MRDRSYAIKKKSVFKFNIYKINTIQFYVKYLFIWSKYTIPIFGYRRGINIEQKMLRVSVVEHLNRYSQNSTAYIHKKENVASYDVIKAYFYT